MVHNKKSWKSLSFVGLVQVVALFTMILSIVTVFDQYHRYLELFSSFKLQYLLSSFFCAVVFALYENYKLTAVLLLITVLNSVFVVPWYFSVPEEKNRVSQASLTLLHSNVYTDNVEFYKFIELVNQEKPDMFVMQEVNQKWLSEIEELEKTYRYKHTIPRDDNFGIALFSKYPFNSVKELNWEGSDVPSIIATFSIAGQQLTFITIHPLPPVSKEYYDSRNHQIDRVSELIRSIQGPLILIGDLNITMWSNDYSALEHGTDLRNARKGFGPLPTWPTQFQLPIFMIPIDHCLVSSHLVVHDIRVGNDIGSDHLPLIVKLGLK